MGDAHVRTFDDGRAVKVNDNDGLRKRCGCARRAWAKCPHDWHFNFQYRHAGQERPTPYRFSLDRYLGRHVATKDEARELRDRIRAEIRAGTFVLKQNAAPEPAGEPPKALTFSAYGAIFLKLCPKRKGKYKGQPRGKNDRSNLNVLGRQMAADGVALGEKTIDTITLADLESVMAVTRANGRVASTRNKYLDLLRLMSEWGVRKGYLPRPWIADLEDSDLSREKNAKRSRRLEHDEERRILQHGPPWLQRLVLAALETCMREGELLNLQWRDVSLTRKEFNVCDSKTGEARHGLPISARLHAILEMVRLDPTGKDHPGSAYVFGDAIGRRARFPQKVWECAVLKAHGHTPHWTHKKALKPCCREALRQIDLEFRDLRHEAGSRMLEAGWPLTHIQLMLGHATVAQTSTYLNAQKGGPKDSMQRFGTTPLHALAPTPSGDHPPAGNEAPSDESQVTVN